MESNELQNGEVVKVRCPSCFKLYAVDSVEIQTSKPQFQCIKCQNRFWFSYSPGQNPDEILGFPADWLNPQGETATPAPTVPSQAVQQATLAARKFHCARCEAEYNAGDKECPKCGVVFAKLEFLEDAVAVPGSPALKKMWRQVMGNYSSLDMHRKFVKACQRENNVLFATHHYAKLLKAHSGDETALKMQNEIQLLTQAQAGILAGAKATRLKRQFFPSLSTIALLVGGVIIGIGFVVPPLRNLIGLGVAVVFFTVAAEWLMRRRS